jgi:ribose transport system substrate-binding protein
VIAACTSPSSGGGGNTGGGGTTTAGGAGTFAIDTSKWPKNKTIAVVAVAGTSEAVGRAVAEAKRFGGQAGWKIEVFDGNGDYGKVSNAVTNYVSQGVHGIVSAVVSPSLIGEGVANANKAKIPVVGVFAGYESSLAADVASNEWISESKVGTYMLERLGGVGGGGKGNVALLNWPNVPALVVRGAVIKNMLSYGKGIKIVSEQVLTVPGQVADAKAKTAALLQRFPKGELDAIWAGWGEIGVAVSQAITEAGRQNDVFTVAIDGNQTEFDEIRKGAPLKATCANDMEGISQNALDSLARVFNGGKPVALTVWVDAPFVTKDTVPAAGQFPKGQGITPYFTG